MLFVQKLNSLPELLSNIELPHAGKTFRKSLTTLLHTFLYLSTSSDLGAVFAALKVSLHFLISRITFLVSHGTFLLLVRVHCGIQHLCMISMTFQPGQYHFLVTNHSSLLPQSFDEHFGNLH